MTLEVHRQITITIDHKFPEGTDGWPAAHRLLEELLKLNGHTSSDGEISNGDGVLRYRVTRHATQSKEAIS